MHEQIDREIGARTVDLAQNATELFNVQALERVLASSVQDYAILWEERGKTYMSTFHGTAAQRLAYMDKGLRIDVEFGQWAAGYCIFDGARPRWRTCGRSDVLRERILTLPMIRR